MQGEKFKFFIKNKDGFYYKYDFVSETVQTTNIKTALQFAPKAWQDMEAAIIRNEKYKGNFAKVSTPLQFVKDGRKIVNHCFLNFGTNSQTYFIIEKQDPNDFSYNTFFSGTLDFETFIREEIYTICNIKEMQLLAMIDANEDVVYEFELTDDNSVWVEMDGINLVYKTGFIIEDGTSPQFGSHTLKLTTVYNENPYTNSTDRVKWTLPIDPNLKNTNQFCYTAGANSVIEINYNFGFTASWLGGGAGVAIPSECGINILYRILKTDGTFYAVTAANQLYFVSGPSNCFGTGTKSHTVTGSKTISLNNGEKLIVHLFAVNMDSGGTDFCSINYSGVLQEFSLQSKLRQPTTIHRGIFPYRLWYMLMYKLSNGQYIGKSLFLEEAAGVARSQILIPGSSLRKDAKVTIKRISKILLRKLIGSTFR
jgi:hypothetical protein